MNKITKVVIILILLMLIPLLFGFINSFWFTEPTVKKDLSDPQIKEISSELKLELMPDEDIYVEYFPGVLQATTYLKVFIENVNSEIDFISRFQGIFQKSESTAYNDSEAINVYDIDIFRFEKIPKDYECHLYFFNKGGNLRAMFYISGYIPELENIYKFSNDYFQPFRTNRIFMITLIIEIFLVIFLFGQMLIRFIKRHRHTQLQVIF